MGKTPRRQWPFYVSLKAKLKGAHKVDFIAAGAGPGAAKGAPDLLDLFAFLTGQPDMKIIENSTREIRAVTHRVSTFSLTSYETGGLPLTIHVGCARLCCAIRESEGRAWLSEKAKGWRIEEVDLSARCEVRGAESKSSKV